MALVASVLCDGSVNGTAFFWLSRERRMASRRRITQATKRPGENKDDQ
jgi:hypothetical protein